MYIRSKVVVSLLALLGSAFANAMVIDETSDAGQTLAEALLLPGGTTGVTGQIDNDVDLFGFSLATDTDLTISAVSNAFDMNLLVFNGMGQGLAGNDDLDRNGGCTVGNFPLDSCLTLSLVAGDYFFAVGANNVSALDINDVEIMEDDSGILGMPTANSVASFTSGTGAGSYRVSFETPSSVPAPASLMLAGLALVGLRLSRRHR